MPPGNAISYSSLPTQTPCSNEAYRRCSANNGHKNRLRAIRLGRVRCVRTTIIIPNPYAAPHTNDINRHARGRKSIDTRRAVKNLQYDNDKTSRTKRFPGGRRSPNTGRVISSRFLKEKKRHTKRVIRKFV